MAFSKGLPHYFSSQPTSKLESCLLRGTADGGMHGKLRLGNPPFVPLKKMRTCRPIMLPGDAQMEDEGCGGGCRKSRAALV